MKRSALVLLSLLIIFLLTFSAFADDASKTADTVQDATKKGDASVCNKIEIFSLRDGCIMSVAVAKGDITLCNTMSAETKQMTGQDKICKAAVSRDAKYCDEITTYMGVGQDEVKNACRMWGKNANITAPAGTPTSILTQLKNKVVSMFFGSTDEKTKPECTSEKDCGDGICDNGNCVESKMTFVFVPVNWKGSMSDFDKKVDERVNLILSAIPLKDCKNSVKIIKSHEKCKILLNPTPLAATDLFQVRECAWRVTLDYDTIIGLIDSVDYLGGPLVEAGGLSIVGFSTVLVTVNDIYHTAHEVGHSLGLKEEYCNFQLKSIGKCGFGVRPNPLKSEEGCREKDSPYDNDEYPDCCISNEYKDACRGNVGLSEAKIAKKIFTRGVYDTIDNILKYHSNVSAKKFNCGDNREDLRKSLAGVADNIKKLYDLQRDIGFTLGRYEQKLQELRDAASNCLKNSDICSCVSDYTGYNLMSPQYLDDFIKFNSRNIMVAGSTHTGRDGPLEFSKPAYDYLSTLPKMKCPVEVPLPTTTSKPKPSSTPSASSKPPEQLNITTIKNATLPSGRANLACAESSSTKKIYCFGGEGITHATAQIIEYDPRNDKLAIKRAVLPSAVTSLSCIGNSENGNIYCFGGYDERSKFSGQIVEYNPVEDTIKVKKASLPANAGGVSCVENVVTHKIFCFAAMSEYVIEYKPKIFQYDPKTDEFGDATIGGVGNTGSVIDSEVLKRASSATLTCAANSREQLIYCFGGQYGNNVEIYKSIEYKAAYSWYVNIFKTTSPDIERLYGHSCAENQNTNTIYCFGGFQRQQNNVVEFDRIIEYSPDMKTVPKIKAIKLPTNRSGLACVWSSASNRFYCFGGYEVTKGRGSATNQIVEYTSESKREMLAENEKIVVKQATLPKPRYWHACAENSATHKIYCFGGKTDDLSYTKIIEYDPAKDTVALKNAELLGRDGAVELSCTEDSSTNKIYCFGGRALLAKLDKIWEYDPSTDTMAIKKAKLPRTSSRAFASFSCVENSATHKIYCFGEGQIMEYVPATDKLIVKTSTIPFKDRVVCAEDSATNRIYCFGGGADNQIWEYDPLRDLVKIEDTVMPRGVNYHDCVESSNAKKFYCFEGSSIITYAPATGAVSETKTNPTINLQGMACAEDSAAHKIYCLGGFAGGIASPRSQIIEYTPNNAGGYSD